MSERECGSCGRPVAPGRCECGATWPRGRRGYGWAGVGAALTPVSALSAYGAVVLARRTVFERPSLGAEATATGAVMVGAAALVALVGPATLARGCRLLADRRAALVDPSPSIPGRAADAVGEAYSKIGSGRRSGRAAIGVVAAGVVLWILAYAAAGIFPRPVFVAITVTAWGAVPLGIAVGGDRPATSRLYATLAVVPFLAAVAGTAYLLSRLEANTK